jgi:hypothetical protein
MAVSGERDGMTGKQTARDGAWQQKQGGEGTTRRALREARAEVGKRNDFSALVRVHVRARDGERCVLCGKPGREVHHIVPRARGGLGTADNGVCLDAACHHQAHRSKQVEKQLLRFRERVLLSYYGLVDPKESVPVEQTEEQALLWQEGLLCFLPVRRQK